MLMRNVKMRKKRKEKKDAPICPIASTRYERYIKQRQITILRRTMSHQCNDIRFTFFNSRDLHHSQQEHDPSAPTTPAPALATSSSS
jgi:hypothetical protein